MKRYPKYKDSGAPWLGQVPAHWEVGKLSRFALESGVKNERMVERNLLSLSYGHIVRKDIEANEGLLPASFEGYQIVERGDTVLRLTDLQNDQRSLRAGYVNERGIITSAYSNVRPSGVTGRWLFNALRASDLLKVFYSMGGGVRQSLDYDAIKRVLIPVPPEEEQFAIDSYLVAEEQRINAAITSQEQMIELLKERRSAIITQAVTKGLDPKAKMKDSGVPWLGQVPAHWEIVPAYVLAPATRRSISVESLKGRKVAHFSIPNVQEFGTAVIEEGDTIDSGKMLIEGLSVLVSRLNPRKRTVAIADVFSAADVTVCSGEFVMFRPQTQLVSKLLSYFFISNPVAAFIESLVASTTKSHGRADPHIIKRMQVSVPPRNELVQIVAFVDRHVSEIDSVISSQLRMIELLKERRSAVITQAVTGQVDVR